MILALVFALTVVGVAVGLLFGYSIGNFRTAAALKLARYLDAIALADDLVKNPDAMELRPRAEALLAAHRKAYKDKES